MVTTHFFHFFPELQPLDQAVVVPSTAGLGVAMSEERFRQIERQQLRRLQMIRKDDEEALAVILTLMRRSK